jgi:hypothetical protein
VIFREEQGLSTQLFAKRRKHCAPKFDAQRDNQEQSLVFIVRIDNVTKMKNAVSVGHYALRKLLRLI